MTSDEASKQTAPEGKRLDLQLRTKQFALRVVRLYSSLPKMTEAQVLGKQVLRSGTSVGAHYREARRARSSPEFISRIECGLQELEETVYWLELLTDAGIVNISRLHDPVSGSGRADFDIRLVRKDCEANQQYSLKERHDFYQENVHHSSFIVHR